MKPLNKPKKDLSILQKRFIKSHRYYHSKKHINEMIRLLKKGYCIEQSHRIASKNVGN